MHTKCIYIVHQKWTCVKCPRKPYHEVKRGVTRHFTNVNFFVNDIYALRVHFLAFVEPDIIEIRNGNENGNIPHGTFLASLYFAPVELFTFASPLQTCRRLLSKTSLWWILHWASWTYTYDMSAWSAISFPQPYTLSSRFHFLPTAQTVCSSMASNSFRSFGQAMRRLIPAHNPNAIPHWFPIFR